MPGDDIVYNSRLVSYLFSVYQFHNAETGFEDAFSVYHQTQDTPDPTTSGYAGGPALPALGHALAGALATASSKVLLYPLELVVTRLQVQRQLRNPNEAESAAKDADAEYKSVLDAAKKIYKHEGLKAFYTGCAPDVGKGIADSFLFFLAYTFLRQRQLTKDGTKRLSVFKELSVGVAAGALAKLVTSPIQNIITRQQTAALVAARDPTSTTTELQSDKLTMKDVALQIRSERGIAGFWAGYSASIILTLNPAITMAIDNLLKSLLPKSKRDGQSPQLTFLMAAISKAIATSITYPVMLAKSRAQAVSPTTTTEAEGTEKDPLSPHVPGVTVADSEPELPREDTKRKMKQQAHRALRLLSAQYAIVLSLQKIYRNEGLSGLYSGLEGEVLKGFISHGFTMMMKEKVHVGVIQLYYLVLRLTKRWPQEVEKAQGSLQAAAGDAKDRASNVTETVTESAKQAIADTRKAVGYEK